MEQARFPKDDMSLPPEIRGQVIGYVDPNDPNFIPNPLDVGTIRTDGIGGSEGHNVDEYSPLFHKGGNDLSVDDSFSTDEEKENEPTLEDSLLGYADQIAPDSEKNSDNDAVVHSDEDLVSDEPVDVPAESE